MMESIGKLLDDIRNEEKYPHDYADPDLTILMRFVFMDGNKEMFDTLYRLIDNTYDIGYEEGQSSQMNADQVEIN